MRVRPGTPGRRPRPFDGHHGPGLFLVAVFSATGCDSRPAVSLSIASPDTVTWVAAGFERSYGRCGDDPCVGFASAWPDSLRGKPDAVTALRLRLDAMLLSDPEGTAREPNQDSVATEYWRQHQAVAAEFPGYRTPWFVERTAVITCNTPGALGLELTVTSYLGGAHPSSVTQLVSLDPETGAPRTLDQVLRPEGRSAFLALAERAFRRANAIPDGTSLTQAGYTFPGAFSLPREVLICDDRVELHYNEYEVAPYALGPTRVRLPVDSLAALLASRPLPRADP